jgi:hypothetical protein
LGGRWWWCQQTLTNRVRVARRAAPPYCGGRPLRGSPPRPSVAAMSFAQVLREGSASDAAHTEAQRSPCCAFFYDDFTQRGVGYPVERFAIAVGVRGAAFAVDPHDSLRTRHRREHRSECRPLARSHSTQRTIRASSIRCLLGSPAFSLGIVDTPKRSG